MNLLEFRQSLSHEVPSSKLSAPLQALWWEAKGDWVQAHSLVDELESLEGMAVHAYLHRKEGSEGNAEYWYARAGRRFKRADLDDEWEALAVGLLDQSGRSVDTVL
jgi:hypothetical protein